MSGMPRYPLARFVDGPKRALPPIACKKCGQPQGRFIPASQLVQLQEAAGISAIRRAEGEEILPNSSPGEAGANDLATPQIASRCDGNLGGL
jgi:hypothetical protein